MQERPDALWLTARTPMPARIPSLRKYQAPAYWPDIAKVESALAAFCRSQRSDVFRVKLTCERAAGVNWRKVFLRREQNDRCGMDWHGVLGPGWQLENCTVAILFGSSRFRPRRCNIFGVD
jgi:hypothetical protein